MERGGGLIKRRPFVKGRRRPFYLTHRRRLFVKKRPFVERGGHSSREGGTIHQRKEEPILSNTQEETVNCGREEAVHQRKRPFVERKEAIH